MPLTENVVASLPLCPAGNTYNNTNDVEELSSDEENLDSQENSNTDQTATIERSIDANEDSTRSSLIND